MSTPNNLLHALGLFGQQGHISGLGAPSGKVRISPFVKPKGFVSYHHDNDQGWFDRFTTIFGTSYDLFSDRSLNRLIDSDNPEYVERRIRENHITGSSLTIVLCGMETWKRKYVDWETCATLNKEHALLGIVLPTQQWNPDNRYYWPERLFDNLRSGYAHWTYWSEDPAVVHAAIQVARTKAESTSLIVNDRLKMRRNCP